MARRESVADRHSTRDTHPSDLTQFKLHLLAVLAEDARYGLAVKRELEEYYGEEVNHGRLYPNLDDLVNKGLVEKRDLDQRTNEYRITDDGRRVLQAELGWLTTRATNGGEP